jgi:hypothetical protein
MKLQAEGLFVHDENGKLTFINDPTEPEAYPAPRFFLGFSESDYVFRFRHDLPQHLCAQVKELIQLKPPSMNLQGSPACAREIEEILSSQVAIDKIWCGPAFWFPDRIEVATEVVYVRRQNADILESGFSDMIPELALTQPCVAILNEGKAVSVCQSVRKTPRAEEAGVDTLEAHRGRGCASLVVAGWAAAVKAKGKIPFYSTSWENRSSQRVAKKLGLIQFGVDYHVT